jgi:CHAT domain-containing protein
MDLLAIGNSETNPNGGGDGGTPDSQVYYDLSSSPGIRLAPLRYSAVEIQNISHLFPAKNVTVLEKENATKRNLRSLPLADYKLIHFSAHSVIDDKKPARSAIILSLNPDQAEDSLLQARDIYNLKLNSDLVILSACQTGLGQFIRGEGIEGLSRAFFYAGSSSVLMSLWSVNDQATYLLMERFYRHLRGSESLLGALRKAKLEMIRSQAISHPYYWAGFTISGKTDSRVFGRRGYIAIIFIGTLGLGMIVALVVIIHRRW